MKLKLMLRLPRLLMLRLKRLLNLLTRRRQLLMKLLLKNNLNAVRSVTGNHLKTMKTKQLLSLMQRGKRLTMLKKLLLKLLRKQSEILFNVK